MPLKDKQERKEYQKAYSKKWFPGYYQRNKKYFRKYNDDYRNKVRKWYREFKATLTCSRCPENHPACITFHHREPDQKEKDVSQMIERCSIETIKAEIEKCEVLCFNCHSKEHWKED